MIFQDPERRVLNVREHRKPEKARQMASIVDFSNSLLFVVAGVPATIGTVMARHPDTAARIRPCRGYNAAGQRGGDHGEHQD